MKPYGIRHVGPVCIYGCCWKATPLSTYKRKVGHGPQIKKRERFAAKREIRAAIRGM